MTTKSITVTKYVLTDGLFESQHAPAFQHINFTLKQLLNHFLTELLKKNPDYFNVIK